MRKESILPVAIDYIQTLKNANTNSYQFSDLVVHILFPAAVSLGMLYAVATDLLPLNRLSDGLEMLVSAVSIVSALLFGLAIMVFQLRVQLVTQKEVSYSLDLINRVDELFHDTLWAIVSGLSFVVFHTVGGFFEGILSALISAISIGFATNFFIVNAMCIKRLHYAYGDVSEEIE